MANYIDLHNHILPGIDDGPRTINEAVMLAKAFVSSGYATVVATPHTCDGRPSPALIIERLNELQSELDRQNVPLKLLSGAEQHIEPLTIKRLQEGEILTLNNSRYLLLELPMLQPLPLYTEQLLVALTDHGYRPIIPHPERVVVLQQDPQLIYRLYEAGAIFQVTWGALTGWLGPAAKKTAHFMLTAKLAHLYATDAHNFATRLLTVDKAAACLEDRLDSGSAELYLSSRPRAVINNELLDLPAPTRPTIRPRRKFPFFSRPQRFH